MFISHSSGGVKFKIKEPADLMSGQDPPPGSYTDSHLLTMSSHGRRVKGMVQVSFIRVLIPSKRSPLPKGSTSKCSHTGS